MSVISEILANHSYGLIDSHTFRRIESDIKRCCPGSYTLRVSEIPKGISIEMIFNDPEEATVFRLKQWM
jgi:hypothetical protein